MKFLLSVLLVALAGVGCKSEGVKDFYGKFIVYGPDTTAAPLVFGDFHLGGDYVYRSEVTADFEVGQGHAKAWSKLFQSDEWGVRDSEHGVDAKGALDVPMPYWARYHFTEDQIATWHLIFEEGFELTRPGKPAPVHTTH